MATWIESGLNILIFVIMAIGLFGTIFPIFPGPLVIWLAGLGYGVLTGFTTLGWVVFILMTVLFLVASVADNVFMGAGARQGGASWISIGLGVLAGVIGTILFPPIGGFIAAPLAVYIYEVYHQGSHQGAMRAIRGMLTGWGISFGVRFLFGMLMIFFWLLWAWLR